MRKYLYDTLRRKIVAVRRISAKEMQESPPEEFFHHIDEFFLPLNRYEITEELFLSDKAEDIMAQLKQDFPEQVEKFREYFTYHLANHFKDSSNVAERDFYNGIFGTFNHSSQEVFKKVFNDDLNLAGVFIDIFKTDDDGNKTEVYDFITSYMHNHS